jgi:sulfite reductase (NADPH) hemoprotein beta-component
MATKRTEVEDIKERSNYLRGTLRESLQNEITGALHPDDDNLIRLHGSYRQADRDLESERKRQKLEPLHSFMIRVRLAGGVSTPRQWLVMDDLADRYANQTLKLTTRQAFQLHGVLKRNLKTTIKTFNDALMDSFAACGDVVRNVMCNPNPHESAVHEQVLAVTRQIHEHFTPKTPAYHEVWLDDELVGGAKEEEIPLPAASLFIKGATEEEVEPIYGKTYLPRKFKIALAIPPYNDSDVFANDIGLIAIEENGELIGFNVAAGGGFGTTFGAPETYPRLADVLGFATTAQILDVVEKIVLIQRDNGDRTNRKQARLKYTIDRMGLENFKAELHQRLGYALGEAKAYKFISNGDVYGWKQSTQGSAEGLWNLTLFVEGGRVKNTNKLKLKTALREIATALVAYNEAHPEAVQSDFRLTGNQNLMICGLSSAMKTLVNASFARYNIPVEEHILSQATTALRRNSLACVALNSCALAFAEAERYLPSLIDKLDVVIRESGLADDAIVIRMTGCPNGCARPYLGEIGFIGRAPGRYNLYLGAGFAGDRLNKLYKEMLNEEEILAELTPIIRRYARYRAIGERFGDFVINAGYVKATKHGKDFHA